MGDAKQTPEQTRAEDGLFVNQCGLLSQGKRILILHQS